MTQSSFLRAAFARVGSVLSTLGRGFEHGLDAAAQLARAVPFAWRRVVSLRSTRAPSRAVCLGSVRRVLLPGRTAACAPLRWRLGGAGQPLRTLSGSPLCLSLGEGCRAIPGIDPWLLRDGSQPHGLRVACFNRCSLLRWSSAVVGCGPDRWDRNGGILAT